MIKIITEQMLLSLREQISDSMGGKRYSHTLGVEREAEKLARLYCSEKINLLRATALLHDLTKEYTSEEHFRVMRYHGIDTGYYALLSHKIYHSLTASLIIPEQYPEFADDELIRAISVHTTGDADMSLTDKLIYLADYIEDTRTFEDCVKLREYFWSGIERGEDKYKHLDRTLLLSFDMTIRDLIDNNNVISDKTVEARNSLLLSMNKGE